MVKIERQRNFEVTEVFVDDVRDPCPVDVR